MRFPLCTAEIQTARGNDNEIRIGFLQIGRLDRCRMNAVSAENVASAGNGTVHSIIAMAGAGSD